MITVAGLLIANWDQLVSINSQMEKLVMVYSNNGLNVAMKKNYSHTYERINTMLSTRQI